MNAPTDIEIAPHNLDAQAIGRLGTVWPWCISFYGRGPTQLYHMPHSGPKPHEVLLAVMNEQSCPNVQESEYDRVGVFADHNHTYLNKLLGWDADQAKAAIGITHVWHGDYGSFLVGNYTDSYWGPEHRNFTNNLWSAYRVLAEHGGKELLLPVCLHMAYVK